MKKVSEKNPSNIKLVIVESPTKAKTIRKFLGKNFIVESCMGHIRDLPQSAKDIPEKFKKEAWANLGVNVDKDFEPLYCIPNNKTKVVKALKDKLSEADEVYLATDEDREGESISWHLLEVLKPKVPYKRMVFHEITKEAIEKSLKQTREIDFNLVRAQEARRILDRLVGYTISPLLWKKIAFGLSAGRVQSVAVKLIVKREFERLRFKTSNYWGITAKLAKAASPFDARLISVDGKRVATGKDFDGLTGKLLEGKDLLLLNKDKASELKEQLLTKPWTVAEIEEKPVSRRAAPPFITSTLQQEANRKLGLSSRETMQVAQKLYEQGFITYMRTDSTFLSKEAVEAARACIKSKYGIEYLPTHAVDFASKKVKGAQEAHEAIRPAGNRFVDPDETGLDGLQFKLYDLIWKRTVACQMVDARQKQLQVKIACEGSIFSASGMTIEFPGFLRAYVEGSDDPDVELAEREVRLPALVKGEQISCKELEPAEHETKPPARYTEASLVQTMEKEGIGRPSTYASIMGTIIDRGYIRKQSNALVPTFTALVVSKLLENYLTEYVDLGFTSGMENSLDSIADGDLNWKQYLDKIYFGTDGLKNKIAVQEKKIDPEEARSIALQGLENFKFKVGRFGAYVETSKDGVVQSASIPEKEAPADITPDLVEKWIEQKAKGADSLGKDPETGMDVFVLTGRYGPYVQLGANDSDEAKPKRASIPPNIVPETLDLLQALEILKLPKKLGAHPDSGKDIKVGIGRFGPYVVCDGDYRSIPKTESVFTMDLDKAVALLLQPKKGRGSSKVIKELGVHAESGRNIQIVQGPYGPYIKAGTKNMSLPEGMTPEQVTMEQAIAIMQKAEPDKGQKKKAAKKVASVTPGTEKPGAIKTKPVKSKPINAISGKTPSGKSLAEKTKSSGSAKSSKTDSKTAKTKPSASPVAVKRKVVLKRSGKESAGRLPG
jgi:DNA topoisomerase-1